MSKFLHDLPIAIKVALAPAFAIICLLIMASVGWMANRTSTAALQSLDQTLMPQIETVGRLRTRITQLDAMVMRSIAYEGSGMKTARVEAVDKAIAQELDAIQSHVAQLAQTAPPEDRPIYEQLSQSLASFSKLARDTIDMKSSGLSQAAMLMTSAEQEHARLSKAVDQLVEQVRLRSHAEVTNATATSERTNYIATAVLGTTVLLAGVMTWLCVRLIVTPLQGVVRMAREIADGNLAQQQHADRPPGRDETGQVVIAMQGVAERLRTLLADIQASAQEIEGASGEIAQGNQNLSMRTEQTASELQQTASTVEHLSGQMHDSSHSAARAHQLAAQAAGIARQGGSAVHEAVTSMEQIATQATRIRDIISVIDSLSFQTNILALNAAVEASRAGEHGRGFAVVAAEVRALAARSATSSKEIRDLIGESVDQVGIGSAKAQAAGQIMGQVVQAIEDASQLITTIARTSEEQASGVSTVSQSVSRMDSSTQQNAALVEQAAAATESLREQARALMTSLAVFRTA